MSKKIMVLALAVVSAALFALPAMASAVELHLDPGTTGETFAVAGPTGGELKAEGEPTITCTTTGGSGTYSSGTTGSIVLDFTSCHTAVFGFTASCKSETAATAGTIASTGTYHLITVEPGNQPAILVTTEPTVIVCAGISKVTVTGNVIGTITSPKCGEASKTLSVSFSATGTTQNHLLFTGGKYDLLSKTGTEAEKTAALVGSATNTTANAQTLTCT
jgi:hypothetical protein